MYLIKAKGKSKHLKVIKTEFCWTDDGIHLLLETVNQYNVFFYQNDMHMFTSNIYNIKTI